MTHIEGIRKTESMIKLIDFCMSIVNEYNGNHETPMSQMRFIREFNYKSLKAGPEFSDIPFSDVIHVVNCLYMDDLLTGSF